MDDEQLEAELSGIEDELGALIDELQDVENDLADEGELGARPRRRVAPARRRAQAARGRVTRARTAVRTAARTPARTALASTLQQARTQAQAQQDRRLGQLVGLGSATIGATATTATLTTTLNKAILGGRLVLAYKDSTSTAPADGQVLVSEIKVGAYPVFQNSAGAPLEMFQADATGAEFEMPEGQSGNTVVVTFVRTAAPGAGASVIVSGGIYPFETRV